ncbi:MAG: molybdopterin-containing oxidoreductase family protein [Acidimicrobiia bacterium]
MTTTVAARTVLGTCHHDCPDSCGWVATVENGVAVKLRGNPDHPFSRGELCPKVNRFLDRVYHPDRVLHPLIRTGAKGAGSFRQASWKEALDLVVNRVSSVIAQHGGEAVYPWWDAGTQGAIQMSSLDRRFFANLGASRSTGSICGATATAGLAATYGSGLSADPTDVRHAKFVVLWATNTRLTNRHLWPFVEEARRNGAQVVVIDPIKTITAGSADWHIQPLPGTDVALMLAVAHVLIRDELIDREYVNKYATGFVELAAHVAAWTPERAASICGLSVDEIERFANAYGTIKPAFIRTLIGAEHHENGAMFYRTLATLPVITGAWRHRGGGLSRSVGSWFETQVDDTVFSVPNNTRGLSMNHLGRHLCDPSIGIHALFVWNGNPLVTIPNAVLIKQGLEREDLFTVVSEQFLTDTARYADVVFPATTELEHLDVISAWGHLYIGWNEPAIAPQGEAVPNTELWRRLAKAMGMTDPEFDLDDEALVESVLVNTDTDLLRKQGWLRLDLPEELLPYASGGFATKDGKALLLSEDLAAQGLDALPTYRPVQEGPEGHLASRFPLVLLTPKNHTRFLNSSYSDHHAEKEGEPYFEIDPADAAARGIEEGDQVRVWNDRAEVQLPVKISSRLRPGVSAIPFGWWMTQAHPNALTNDTLTDWGGGVAFFDTLVEAAKAG